MTARSYIYLCSFALLFHRRRWWCWYPHTDRPAAHSITKFCNLNVEENFVYTHTPTWQAGRPGEKEKELEKWNAKREREFSPILLQKFPSGLIKKNLQLSIKLFTCVVNASGVEAAESVECRQARQGYRTQFTRLLREKSNEKSLSGRYFNQLQLPARRALQIPLRVARVTTIFVYFASK